MVGNWKLDVAQSDFGFEPAPKSETGTVFKDTPQTLVNARWLLLVMVGSELVYCCLQVWAFHLRATLPTH
jgi:hypothetical protein